MAAKRGSLKAAAYVGDAPIFTPENVKQWRDDMRNKI
jgi:hypothetical protein